MRASSWAAVVVTRYCETNVYAFSRYQSVSRIEFIGFLVGKIGIPIVCVGGYIPR